MNVLDLFSGIGGFSLGLERAGMRTVAFCEIEPFQRAVLKKHWPEVPCYDDVSALTSNCLRADGISVDVICGGFPCQDISYAGDRAGLEGERSGLWKEYARLIGELRPRYVVVENVTALLNRGLDVVLGDLAALGYDAEWHCIPASALGAPQSRDRTWIIAYPTGKHVEQVLGPRARQGEFRGSAWDAWPSRLDQSFVCREANGLPGDVDRISALGNAVVPQIPEIIGRAIMKATA